MSFPTGLTGYDYEPDTVKQTVTDAEQMGSVTFKNDRQKASISVYKQDKETRKYLPGGTYGLYAGNDIKAADGTVVVKKDTLIEKAVTGTDGKAVYQADLPDWF